MSRMRGLTLGVPHWGGKGDTIAPTCVVSTAASEPVQAAFEVTITFSEDVTGFTVGDLTVTDGAASGFAGSGAVYTCTITPDADASTVSIEVGAGVCTDAAGNENTASNTLEVDVAYAYRVKVTQSANLIAYWPLWETSGLVADDISGNNRDGANSGVTPGGATGIGDGNTAYSFDGTADVVNLYSASLAGAFSGAAGTLALWAQVHTWNDAQARALIRLLADGQNFIEIVKGAAGSLYCYYRAGNTEEQVQISSTSTAWLHVALTWNKSADQFKVYLNGSQSGSTQTGLGTWVGSLSSTAAILGAQSLAGLNNWRGAAAHTALWTKALTPAEVAILATVPS